MEAKMKNTNLGKITQIISVVVDVKFEGAIPNIYNALKVKKNDGTELILEVEQIRGDNTVRTIAMSTTDGLARGAEVEDTGKTIMMPVGDVVLGRIFNVCGDPIDRKPFTKNFETRSIHREAPSLKEQNTKSEPLFTKQMNTIQSSSSETEIKKVEGNELTKSQKEGVSEALSIWITSEKESY